jgi:hypothetical protein
MMPGTAPPGAPHCVSLMNYIAVQAERKTLRAPCTLSSSQAHLPLPASSSSPVTRKVPFRVPSGCACAMMRRARKGAGTTDTRSSASSCARCRLTNRRKTRRRPRRADQSVDTRSTTAPPPKQRTATVDRNKTRRTTDSPCSVRCPSRSKRLGQSAHLNRLPDLAADASGCAADCAPRPPPAAGSRDEPAPGEGTAGQRDGGAGAAAGAWPDACTGAGAGAGADVGMFDGPGAGADTLARGGGGTCGTPRGAGGRGRAGRWAAPLRRPAGGGRSDAAGGCGGGQASGGGGSGSGSGSGGGGSGGGGWLRAGDVSLSTVDQ